ncbi:MAG: hypothetical protein ACRDGD_03780 [Candidatus Limnocylindria bacterium]
MRDDLPASAQAELAVAVLRAMDRWSVRQADAFDDAAWERMAAGQFAALRRLLGT